MCVCGGVDASAGVFVIRHLLPSCERTLVGAPSHPHSPPPFGFAGARIHQVVNLVLAPVDVLLMPVFMKLGLFVLGGGEHFSFSRILSVGGGPSKVADCCLRHVCVCVRALPRQ